MSTSKSGGCGCAGCDCGSGACTDESFKRPRFFAGQLLTEDDLQAMMDYVVGKNRLHNRYLFGEGVVCGLTVGCHPCGGGKVIVAPGYGLDCCGNDLLLPCPEEVDIRALVRDLRKRQLAGYECGDPCEEEGDRRHYGLYLVYRETPSDPIAPYTSGDPCGQQGCEPSRICEGYDFELRCECTLDQSVGLFCRIRACIGDLKTATGAVDQAQKVFTYAMDVKQGGMPNAQAREQARRDAALLKAWLLTKLETGTRTRCDLRDRVLAVRIDTGARGTQDPTREELVAEADQQLELVKVLLEYFIDCACLALNPPCSPCDDTALLLSCIELDGCEVVDICNMSRRFVLSPAAMRYWLPVNLVGDALQSLCCSLDLSGLFKVERRDQPTDIASAPAAEPAAAPAAAPPPDADKVRAVAQPMPMRRGEGASIVGENTRVALERFGLKAEEVADAAAFSTSFANLALRTANVDTGGLRRRSDAVVDDLIARVRPDAASVLDTPAANERMSLMIREEVALARETVATELRADIAAKADAAAGTLGKSAAELSKKVSDDVERRVNAAVSKELGATRLKGAVENTAVVKTLKTQNATLVAEVRRLSAAVKKLEGTPR